MATTQERKAENQKLIAKLKTMQAGSPEYQRTLTRINYNRKQMGIKDPYKPAGAPAQDAPVNNTPAPVDQGDQYSGTSPIDKKEAAKIDTTQGAIAADKEIADLIANQNVQLGTAGKQVNPFGTQEISRDPVTGQITQTQTLSKEQQDILDKSQGLTQSGLGMAQNVLQGSNLGQAFNPQLAARTSSGDMLTDRARIENEVFGRLTRGMDEEKNRERSQLEQSLFNRGIPVGSQLFNQQMSEFDKRYDTRAADARAQAAELGGAEWGRSFGINEQLIANQLNQAQSVQNQNLQNVGALSQFGSGLQLPQFQGYQGTTYSQPGAVETWATIQGVKQNQQQINQQKRPAGGGGGTGQPAQPQSPFNNSLPPGVG